MKKGNWGGKESREIANPRRKTRYEWIRRIKYILNDGKNFLILLSFLSGK